MGILLLNKQKMGFTCGDLQAAENFLNENQFLSGKELPGADDMSVLEGLNANGTVPDFEAFPNVFGWFWTLNALNPPCRALYTAGGAKTEEDKAAAAEQEKKNKEAEEAKKKAKKVVIAKSLVTFDVKGYEEDQDFEALAKKIKSEITMDGLVWMDKHEVKPIAFGMKKLQIAMLIEDAKIQTDDVFELIEAWEDDVQSTDIVSFAKA